MTKRKRGEAIFELEPDDADAREALGSVVMFRCRCGREWRGKGELNARGYSPAQHAAMSFFWEHRLKCPQARKP